MEEILLISPPYGDFTYPYHSLSYLAGPLKAAGYRVTALDLNIEWIRSLLRRDRFRQWEQRLATELAQFEARPHWSLVDQRRVVKLVGSLAALRHSDPESAIQVLTTEKFYEYESYLRAQATIRNFERVLETIYPSYPFYSAFAAPPGEPNASELIAGVLNSDEFIDDVRDILRRRCGGRNFVFCGMSAAFYGNLRLGFAALDAVRREFPSAVRVAGGTGITDMFRNRKADETLLPFSQYCDYLLPGEGDVAVVELAHWLTGRSSNPPTALVDLERANHRTPSSVQFVGLKDGRVPPDYSWIQWDLYLSPERQVNYSPTRGCFWNKCTFCDYGLNTDKPTAPYRSEAVDTTLDSIQRLTEDGVKHVYLSVDAVAPPMLRELAQRLVEERVAIHWSAEVLLTKSFSPDLIELLDRSGFVTASFGFESGSSRVLELMGKGRLRVEEVYEPVFKTFAKSRIGLQPKFFFGFPTETDADRSATVALLNRNRDVMSIVTSGNVFDLTAGSIVAKTPERFGLRNVRRKPGHDIDGACDYDVVGARPPRPTDFSRLNEELDYFQAFERPWCGGIDTFHSKLYMCRYGRGVFHQLREQFRHRDDLARPWLSIDLTSHFDLEEAFNNVLLDSALGYECSLEPVRAVMDASELDAARIAVMAPLERSARLSSFSLRFK